MVVHDDSSFQFVDLASTFFLDDRMINGNVPQPCLFLVSSRRVWKTKQPHYDMNVTLPVSHSNQVLNIETTKIQGSLCNSLEPGGFNRVSTMKYAIFLMCPPSWGRSPF